MPSVSQSAKLSRFPGLRFSLLALAAVTLLLPGAERAQAQTTFACSAESGTNCALSVGASQTSASTSTFSVPTAGTIQSISVELHGVWSNGNTGYSMGAAEFLLTGPGGSFDILGGTGDTVDGADDFSTPGDANNGLHGLNIIIEDSASNAAPMSCGELCSAGESAAWPEGNGSSVGNAGTTTVTVKPNSYFGYNPSNQDNPPILGVLGDWPAVDGCNPDPIIGNGGSYNNAAFCSAPTLTSKYQTTTANGPWTLTVQNASGTTSAISITDWSLTISYATAISTTTAISSNGNPSNAANSVTFTATVTASGSPLTTGTVTFTANSGAISGCSGKALNSSGQASCTTSSLGQGNNSVEASYTPGSGYGASSNTMTQLVEVTPTQSGNTWCNTSPIAAPGNAVGVQYPSFIHVSGYPGGTTVSDVSVELKGATGPDGVNAFHLLVAPGGQYNLDFFDATFAYLQPSSPVNLTIFDTAGQLPSGDNAPSTGNYEPYDDDQNGIAVDSFQSSVSPSYDSSIPQVPGTINRAKPFGGTSLTTFQQAFNNAPLNGDWALYVYAGLGGSETVNNGWCATFTVNTGVGTTTSLGSNQNPQTTGQSVTITATVKVQGSGDLVTSGGTVTFLDNGVPPAGVSNNTVTLNGSGQAAITTSSLAEGDHVITATYSGTSSDNASYTTWTQRMDNATQVYASGAAIPHGPTCGSTYCFCNPGAVTTNAAFKGPFIPDPSNIFVTNLPGNVSAVTLGLNQYSSTATILYALESMVVGPTGADLDFFSNAGYSSGGGTASLGNFIFSDAGSAISSSVSTLSPGTYKPASFAEGDANWPEPAQPYTASSSGFYTLPSTITYATPTGSGTFADQFENTNPNGAWSLYMTEDDAAGVAGAANGWCVNLTETTPTVTVTTESTDTFAPGQNNAPLTVHVDNSGSTGPTGDPTTAHSNPMKVTATLNSAFTFASGSGTGWDCSASSGQSVSCSNDGAIAQGSDYNVLTVDVNVSPTASTSGTIPITWSAAGAGVASTSSNSDTVTIVAPATITKSFTPSSIQVNGTSTLTLTITNPNASLALTSVAFTDSFPTGLVIATPSGAGGTCTGTVTATAGTGSVILSGGSINAGASCNISVSVTGTAAGTLSNTAGGVSSFETGAGSASNTAALTVIGPPTITKTFGASTIPLNGSTSLSFSITNPNSSSLSGVGFTDSLPAGLNVASTPAVSNSCGGTVAAVGGTTTVSLSGGSIGTSGPCTLSVNVTGVTAGVWNNTTGAVTSTEGGTGTTSNTATITVLSPPSISKSFGSATTPLNSPVVMTFTITNPNSTASLTGVGVSDSFPPGLQVAMNVGPSSNCGALITATAGSTSASFSGGTIAPSGTCIVSLNVTGTTAGLITNTTGNVSSTNGGTGNTGSASLTVVAPPTISKVFAPATIQVNGTSTLTFTISNPNAAGSLTGVGFTDTFPAGLQVASNPNVTTSGCGGGAFSPLAASGATSLSFSGATVSISGPCSVSVNVTSATAGVESNSVGAAHSNEGGTGTAGSMATLTVIAPPTFSKAFGLVSQIAASPTGATEAGSTVTITTASAHGFLTGESATIAGVGVAGYNGTFTIASVPSPTAFTYTDANTGLASSGGGVAAVTITTLPLNATATLAFTLSNSNASSLTGVSFTDALPSGLQVATTPNVSTPCGTFAPNAGDTTLSFSAGTLAGSTGCFVKVNVTATTAGVKNNVTAAVTSNEGGTGTMASATLTVLSPPSISKAFGAANIAPNGTTTLTFTITNPNASNQLTGVGFTDSFPSGLQVGGTPGVTITGCGSGAFSPTPASGDASVTFSGGTIADSGTCTVVVNVTGTTGGVMNNTTGNVSSDNGGVGNTASATLTVASPPTINNAFGVSAIALNGTTSLTFTLTNPNTTLGLTGVSFTDSLPAGLAVVSSTTTHCGGAFVTTAPGTIGLSGATIAANNGTCVVSVTVTGASAGVMSNTTGAVSSNESGTGSASNTATLTVVGPPTIAKAFGLVSQIAASPTGATEAGSTVTITTVTPHGFLTGESGTIAGVGVAGYNGAFTIASVPTPTTFTYTDTNTGLAASGGGTATALITTLPLNGTATLAFSLTNPNAGTALTGVSFTDPLPAGLQVAATPNASSPCGTFAPNAGDTTLNFSAGTLPSSATCGLLVNVTATTAGAKNNVTGAVTSTEGGTGGTASATLTVLSPPSISKAFGAANIAPNGTTTLTFTITNPNASNQLTGVGFTDSFPSGLQVGGTPGVTITGCGSGAFSPTPASGDASVTFSGGTIADSGTCTVVANVTGTSGGVMNNTTGNVSSDNGGVGNTSSASLTVASPPTINNAFGVSAIALNGTTSLTFTLTNPNTTLGLTGVSFTDSLPAGLAVVSSTTTHCGGAFVTTAPGTIGLSGATIAASNGTCVVSVTVTGASAGVMSNTTGAVSSNESGTGSASNTATLTVVGPPTIAKAFGAPTIPLNGATSLTFTIGNLNTTVSLTGVAFTDSFPAGLQVAATPGASSTCGGTFAPTAGATSVSFSGGAIVSSANCTVSVNVTGVTAGVMNNTSGAISSNEGGTGTTSNTAPITVLSPPTITKAFGASNIPVNGTTTLTFTVANSNTTASLTGVAFSDSFPAGLQVASTPGGSNTCGGMFAPIASATSISLSGGTISSSSSCTVSLNVTGIAGGVKNNVTGNVSSTNGGTGNTGSATLDVADPPTISKAFGASTIPLGGVTSLTFTITNPNSALGLTGVGFTDALPAGTQVAATPGASNTCGGTFAPASGATSVTLSSGTIASSANCTISVTVTGTSAGVKNNTTGAVSSNESGTGTTSNTATLTVVAPPTITKAFGAPTIPLNGSTSLTFTVNNSNTTQPLTGVAFLDSLPAGLQVAATPGASNTCSGTFAPASGATSIGFSGGTIASSADCTVSVSVTGITAGVMNNTTGAVSSTNGGTGTVSNTATLTVLAPPSISKAFGAALIPPNGATTLTFTVTNPNSTASLTGVAFTDNLPAGLQVASSPGATSSCGGTLTATASATSASLSGGTISSSGLCTISVNVTGTTSGTKNNVTGNVSSTNGGTGNTGSATIVVGQPPAITSANSATFTVGTAGSFTVTTTGVPTPSLSEIGAALLGVSFHDNGNGTATFSGIPRPADAGVYSYVITAANGISPNATQSFTLTILEAPFILSANETTFIAGASNSFRITAAGYPTPLLSQTGTLPAGVIFADSGQGSAALAGTPSAGSSGTYSIAITAANGTLPNATQSFTLTVVANSQLWIGDANNTTAAFSVTGAPYLTTPESGAGSGGVAIDSAGNVWSVSSGSNSVAEFAGSGTVVNSGYTGGGLSTPAAVAIDGAGQVWVANSNNSISVLSSSGAPLSPGAYTGGGLSSPSSIAIDISGNLWIANSGSNSVTEVLGAAAPTVPLATGAANNSPATKP